jgi:hypothetical protein
VFRFVYLGGKVQKMAVVLNADSRRMREVREGTGRSGIVWV